MDWFSSTSPVDELVDKATSENLPVGTEDLALNLEICDQIRSKQVTPKDAAKALRRRISHKNPNVQLLALGLTDVCAKNGGQHFLLEIASREFIDNLTSILKAPAGCNPEVKTRILGLIQIWGRLFRGKQGLGYACDTYMILQHEGYEFPPLDNVGAALLESEAPPDWTDSDVCTRCRSAFTLTNRKHHCRACGSTFCGQCSSKTMALPHLGVTQEVRVCDGCWMKKKLGNKSVLAAESHGVGGAPEFVPSATTTLHSVTSTSAAPNNGPSNNGPSNDDDDLLRAIELSLKEANSQPGYSAPSTKRTEPEASKKTAAPVEEEDADLLAAIEASLLEASLGSSNMDQSAQRGTAYSSYTYASKPTAAAVSPNELTDTEKLNIEMFSTLVDRIQMMQGDVAGNREVQALYEQISKLQMKVALNLEETAKKQHEFMECNEKIDQAVRIYDQLLQERLNSAYQRRMTTNNYVQQAHHLPGSHGQYNSASPPHTPQASHVYPNFSHPDSRYTQYVPGYSQNTSGPMNSQPQAPYQPAPSHPAGYSLQPSATAPFAGSSSAPLGQEYASAPFASAPGQPPLGDLQQPAYSYQAQTVATAPAPQDPHYAVSAPPSMTPQASVPASMGPIQSPLQNQTQDPGNHGQYGSFAQQPSYPQPSYAPPQQQVLAPPAPQPTVEEAPLIEL